LRPCLVLFWHSAAQAPDQLICTCWLSRSVDSLELTLIGIALGIFVGVVLGLTGAGGAILSVPLLGFFLHCEVAQAAPIG